MPGRRREVRGDRSAQGDEPVLTAKPGHHPPPLRGRAGRGDGSG
jgi:hypothetical protein